MFHFSGESIEYFPYFFHQVSYIYFRHSVTVPFFSTTKRKEKDSLLDEVEGDFKYSNYSALTKQLSTFVGNEFIQCIYIDINLVVIFFDSL